LEGTKCLVRNMIHIAPRDERVHRPREAERGCVVVLIVIPNCVNIDVGEGLGLRRNCHILELEVLNRVLLRLEELDVMLV